MAMVVALPPIVPGWQRFGQVNSTRVRVGTSGFSLTRTTCGGARQAKA